MKILFLDIDGVLNSAKYDRIKSETSGNIDSTRLPLLKRIVDETDAKIVLTSTWRKLWDNDEIKNTATGRELNRIFEKAGLKIFDKTSVLGCRKDEVSAWLSEHPETERFCIIDDMLFGWDELSDYLVRTDPLIGYGLEEKHMRSAIEILNQNL